MSIDLTYPLVLSMGQHDPLDGFVTYSELQVAATGNFEESSLPSLQREIAEMAKICQSIRLATDDPLGIGGLLFDASRLAQLMMKGVLRNSNLLETVVNSALLGMEAFSKGETLGYPAKYRLAFRELGLSIGISAAENLLRWTTENPDSFSQKGSLERRVEELMEYVPLRERIEQFWIDDKNRQASTWIEHCEINMEILRRYMYKNRYLTNNSKDFDILALRDRTNSS